jgi:hypothetical protein
MAAEERELESRIARAIAELPRGQREAVVAFYVGGLTYAETASALGIAVGAVKTRLHKSRERLRAQLASEGRVWVMASRVDGTVEMRLSDVVQVSAEDDGSPQWVITGWTGDLVGASMRTVSMRVVIMPPHSEGLPTASSQTVPLDGASFPFSLFGEGRNARTPSGRPARSGSSGSRPASSRRSGYRLGSPFGFASTKVIVNGGRPCASHTSCARSHNMLSAAARAALSLVASIVI